MSLALASSHETSDPRDLRITAKVDQGQAMARLSCRRASSLGNDEARPLELRKKVPTPVRAQKKPAWISSLFGMTESFAPSRHGETLCAQSLLAEPATPTTLSAVVLRHFCRAGPGSPAKASSNASAVARGCAFEGVPRGEFLVLARPCSNVCTPSLTGRSPGSLQSGSGPCSQCDHRR